MRYFFFCLALFSLHFSFAQFAYQSHSYDGQNLKVECKEGVLDIKPYSTAMVKCTFLPAGSEATQLSNAVIMMPQEMKVKFQENAEKLTLSWGEFRVEVGKEHLGLRYYYNDRLLTQAPLPYSEMDDYIGLRFALRPEEKIMGAGFRALPMNRRGDRLSLYNEPHYGYGMGSPDLNFSIPFVQSDRLYGLFVDNPQKGYLDIGKSDTGVMEWGFIGGELSYYVIAGDTWPQIMESYSRLTGRQPLPPRWAFGNFLSRFGYKNEQEARQMMDTMKQLYFPLDAIVIDLFWFGKGVHDSFYMGNFEWDREAWPNPQRMMSDFRKEGVKTVLIMEPFIMKESKNFDYCASKGLLATDEKGNPFVIKDFWFGPTGLLDIFKTEAQDWFWQQYEKQKKLGVAGWWGDLGEPEKHPSEIRHVNGTADQVHNLYGHWWSKMLFEKYAENYPEERLFHLNRSGYAGSQRYAVFPWSGDVSRSWSGLKAQLPVMLGMAMSGIPYMHSDLGGFAMGRKDEELYTRWMQMGTFNPLYRPHGSGIPSEPVFFSEETKQIVRKYINLRYRFLPYNYTLAWEAESKGLPLMRPLFFDEPGNASLYDIDDTYLWGDHILVAPVVDSGQGIRDIYLPKGTWINYHTDERVEGGQWIHVPVYIHDIPIYVRAGSILPLALPVSTTDDYRSETLELNFFPGEADSTYSYVMYDDDGKTKDAFKKGQYELLTILVHQGKESWEISSSRSGGSFEGRPEKRKFILSFHGVKEVPEKIVFEGTEYWIPRPGKKLPKGAKQANHQPGSGRIFIRTSR